MKLCALAASLAVGLVVLPDASAQVRGTGGIGVGDEEDLRLEGGLTIPAGGNLAFLLDGEWAQDDNFDVYSATGHLITRNAGRAWGGFIRVTRADLDFADIDTWTIGGEYARFLPRYTLAARVDFSAIDDLGAGLSLVDDGDDGVVLGGGAEYRFGSSPFSIGGRVGWINADDNDETTFGVTARFDFGNRTLKDRDRNGNTFGVIGSMISSILP
jgi:hypothetical protein